jgi:hypothetical protein
MAEGKMGFLIGLFGLAVGVTGFWLDFDAHPIPTSADPFISGYFDVGAAGILVATLGFLMQLFSFAFRRTAKSGLVRLKA